MHGIWQIAAVAALTLLGLYLAVAPFIRPAPVVETVVSQEIALGQDLPIRIRVRSWQSPVQITNVRFYVDYYQSTAKGPEGLFNPDILASRRPELPGPLLPRLFAWPRTQTLDVTAPLKSYADEGLLGHGELVGKVDVWINYIRPGRRPIGTPANDVTRMYSVPFRIAVK